MNPAGMPGATVYSRVNRFFTDNTTPSSVAAAPPALPRSMLSLKASPVAPSPGVSQNSAKLLFACDVSFAEKKTRNVTFRGRCRKKRVTTKGTVCNSDMFVFFHKDKRFASAGSEDLTIQVHPESSGVRCLNESHW